MSPALTGFGRPPGAAATARRWVPLGLAPAAIYGGHFFLGAALDVPALTLLAVLAGLLCLSLCSVAARAELAELTPAGPPVALFGLVIGAALLSLTAAAPGGPHPVWLWVDAAPAASLNRSATLIEIVKLIGLAAVFVLGCVMGGTGDRARRSLQVILWLGAAYALTAFLLFFSGAQVAHVAHRLSGGFYTANVAATQFGVLAVLSVSWAVRQWRRSARAPIARRIADTGPALAALMLFLLCLVMTASRAGLGATGLALVVVIGWEAIGDRRARWPLIAGGCGLVILAAVVLVRGNTLFIDRFDDVAGAGAFRAMVYEAHWRAFLASPLSGYGLGAYPELNNQLMTAGNVAALSDSVILHNAYLQWLVEAGVVGATPMFVLVAFILGVIAWRGVRRPRHRGLLVGILASAVLVLIHAAVDVPLNTPSLEAFWALLLGLGYALAQARESRR